MGESLSDEEDLEAFKEYLKKFKDAPDIKNFTDTKEEDEKLARFLEMELDNYEDAPLEEDTQSEEPSDQEVEQFIRDTPVDDLIDMVYNKKTMVVTPLGYILY